jgi:hypothetical protein
MKRLLIYYNFIIISLMVIVGFVSAANYTQLVAAILFFPLFIYFAVRVFPRRVHAVHLPKEPVVIIQPSGTANSQKIDPQVLKLKKEGVDIDRRMFLKLIGTAGISLFLFSLFTKKAEAAFFGSVPGPGTVSIKDIAGNKINPAEKEPLDGYRINQIDDSETAYYGFTNADGAWFILRNDDVTGDFRYAKGASDFSTNWGNRISLTYDYYNNVF